MRFRIVCGVGLLAAVACSDNGPTGPDVPSDVLGPSPIGATIPVGVEVVATGLVSPVQLVQPPGNDPRRFVVDQVGVVRVLNADGTLQPAPYLDLRGRMVALNAGGDERGLLSLAFHPSFGSNGRLYVFYSRPLRAGAPAGFNHTNVVSELREAGGAVSLATERVILQVDHPQANHNGGTVAFGPDGYLYVSLGDGGAGADVGLGHVNDWYAANSGGNGQDVEQNLLGGILRIDVDGGDPYAVPPDNPFVNAPGLDEIWAYGFRNPYRIAFDPGGSHILLAGDAGQNLWEEVSRVVKGGNFGWNVREGTHCFSAHDPTQQTVATCPDTDPVTGQVLRSPVIEFANTGNPAGGLSVTVVGGHVYRGQAAPALRGMYVFGGFGSSAQPSGRLWAARIQSQGLWTMQELLINGSQPLGSFVKGFGQDRAGEVYVMATQVAGPTGTTGRVLRLRGPGAAVRADP